MSTLYDMIAGGYDTTRRADPYLTARLADALAQVEGRLCLDLACGSGNYTIAIARNGLAVHGTDRSRRMIAAATAKSPVGGLARVTWSVADATALPFATGAFAGVVCTLALHHFPALPPVFAEVRRTLRSGPFVIFTATREQMGKYWLREYFPIAMERSAQAMPASEEIVVPLRQAGFSRIRLEPYEVAPDLQDLFLYSGKHRPAMYLDHAVRANISTFATQADPSEVAEGCARLAADIASGRIAEIIERHVSDHGDYVFVVADA